MSLTDLLSKDKVVTSKTAITATGSTAEIRAEKSSISVTVKLVVKIPKVERP